MNIKLILWGLGGLLFAASFLVREDPFDIQVYATYYVIGWGSLLKGLSLLFFLTGRIYFLLKRQVRS